jgi:GNAT superfamily N-acetyltransferase
VRRLRQLRLLLIDSKTYERAAYGPPSFAHGIIGSVATDRPTNQQTHRLSEIAFLTARQRPIDALDIRRLYDGASWWPGWEPASIAEAVAATIAVGAWDGDRLIGFTRALSDGVHRAYVEDVVVDPAYRGQGIGEKLVAALMEELAGVHIVSLFCLPERADFYRRNGFEPEEQVMMHRRLKGVE